MLTRKIDAALDAMDACREKVPALVALYRPGTPLRDALEALVEAANRADAEMFRFTAEPPLVGRADEGAVSEGGRS